jgi:hypothetical protein
VAVVAAQVQKVKVDGNKIQQIVVSVANLVHWDAGLVSSSNTYCYLLWICHH